MSIYIYIYIYIYICDISESNYIKLIVYCELSNGHAYN